MTFRDFKAAVNALLAHDLAAVPCDDVTLDGTDVTFLNASELVELEEAREEIRETEKECTRLNDLLENAERDIEKVETMLSEFKDGTLTVLGMKARMENAEDLARRYRTLHDQMLAELTAMRKRKGIDCNIFAHRNEVLNCLNEVTACAPQDLPAVRARIREVLGRVYAK